MAATVVSVELGAGARVTWAHLRNHAAAGPSPIDVRCLGSDQSAIPWSAGSW